MTRVKICGLKRIEDAEIVNEFMPEMVGFVFYKASKRYVDVNQALVIKRLLNPKIETVGVFVDASLKEIESIAQTGAIDYVQLHGHENEQFVDQVKREIGLPVIKAFSIKSQEDVILAEKSSADYILLDNGKGGTGQTFDWELLKGLKRPYILAGGINPDNVAEAVTRLKPYQIDVSSGVERAGCKNRELINELYDNLQ